MKIIHAGFTETALMLICSFRNEVNAKDPFILSKLFRAWTSMGMYDKSFNKDVLDIQSYSFQEYLTPFVQSYFEMYVESIQKSDYISILPAQFNDADRIIPDGASRLRKLIDPVEFLPNVSFRLMEKMIDSRRCVYVSPFSPLMQLQHDQGKMKQLRPSHSPSNTLFIQFPYCFANNGPSSNSFETISLFTELIATQTQAGDAVVLSCGSMGVHIGARLEKLGRDIFYAGGGLQLYFGIMGNRWRNRQISNDDFLLGSYITNKELWIDNIPDDLVPSNAAIVEGKCYW
jgi:hypothetical protein